ncbi:hypothetical protein BC830DRAFT_623155, partial [Chytriomyces sp. MP71]
MKVSSTLCYLITMLLARRMHATAPTAGPYAMVAPGICGPNAPLPAGLFPPIQCIAALQVPTELPVMDGQWNLHVIKFLYEAPACGTDDTLGRLIQQYIAPPGYHINLIGVYDADSMLLRIKLYITEAGPDNVDSLCEFVFQRLGWPAFGSVV